MVGLNIILDAATVLLVALFAIRGARRGFVMTVSSLVAVVIAYIGAGIAAQLLSPLVAGWIEPLLAGIELPEIVDEDALAGLSLAGVNIAGLEIFGDASDALNEGAEQIAQHIVTAVSRVVAYAVVAAVAFVVILIVVRMIFKAIDIVAKLPVLHMLNKLFGLLGGLALGILIMITAAWIIGLFDAYVTAEEIDATFIYKYFADPPTFLKLFR